MLVAWRSLTGRGLARLVSGSEDIYVLQRLKRFFEDMGGPVRYFFPGISMAAARLYEPFYHQEIATENKGSVVMSTGYGSVSAQQCD